MSALDFFEVKALRDATGRHGMATFSEHAVRFVWDSWSESPGWKEGRAFVCEWLNSTAWNDEMMALHCLNRYGSFIAEHASFLDLDKVEGKVEAAREKGFPTCQEQTRLYVARNQTVGEVFMAEDGRRFYCIHTPSLEVYFLREGNPPPPRDRFERVLV